MKQDEEYYYYWLEIQPIGIKLFSRKFKNKNEMGIFWEKGYPDIFENFYCLAGRPKMSFCETTKDRFNNPLKAVIHTPEYSFGNCFAVVNRKIPVSERFLILDCSDLSDLCQPLHCIDFFSPKLVEEKGLLLKAFQR